MKLEQLEGNWQKLKGYMHKQLGKLTDNDLMESQGKAEILIGKITEKYGVNKEVAQKKLNQFLKQFDDAGNEVKSSLYNLVNLKGKLNSAVKNGQKFIKEKPFTAVSIIAVTGALLGAWNSRSHK